MAFNDMLGTARDAITVRRVFGEPYEKEGLTVVPVARLAGGGGGGSGQDDDGQQGDGGGFGMMARPAGVYVIGDGQVSWRPAIDPNRIAGAIAGVLVAAIIARAATARSRA